MLFRSLLLGESDFGIGPAHEHKDAEFKFEPLLNEDVIALVPKKFKPDLDETIRLKELARMPVLQLSNATALRSVLDTAVKNAGISLEPKYECSQAQTLIAMANAELGAAILPRSIVPKQVARHMQSLRIVAPSLKRKIGLITRNDRPLLPAAARLTALIRDHFQNTASCSNRA